MICEGIMANGIHTYKDLELCIAERKVMPPVIRSNRKTVPYMHGSYDFTCIAGEPIYDDTTIDYTFDIAEFETVDMEKKKSELLGFLTGIQDMDFEDDFSPDYYYHGSYATPSWEEDFGQGQFTAQLVIHPFKTAKKPTSQEISEKQTVINESDCNVFPMITATQPVTIIVNGVSYSFASGTHNVTDFVLKRGANTIEVINEEIITVSYYKRKLV